MREYVLIVGQGRSGTNWLLSLLDFSPITHCRNEPNEIREGLLAKLPSPWVECDPQPELEAKWDDAVRWASTRLGERDSWIGSEKQHVYEFSRRLGLPRILERRRLRSLMALFLPSLRGSEWLMPRWMGSRIALEKALPVLKCVQVPGWAAWVSTNRASAQVLHIVRHPGGFLNSWRNRYLALHDSEAVSDANRARLKVVMEAAPSWARLLRHVDRMSVEESELWYWRYACETIHNAGVASPNYELIIYERLVADPVGMSRRIYDVCGLLWDDRIENACRRTSSDSKRISDSWRSHLSEEQSSLVTRILEGSLMQRWWD